MNLIKLSEFIDDNNVPPFILVCFYGTHYITDDNKYFYTKVFYKKNKYIQDSSYDNSLKNYKIILDKYSGNFKWSDKNDISIKIKNSNFFVILENDLKITNAEFFNILYKKIVTSNIINSDFDQNEKKHFIRGFFEMRGSIDISAQYLTNDYLYETHFESKKIRLLTDHFNIPLSILNLNFRELQNDYITGKCKRKTQLRVSLAWYVEEIGILNEYKTKTICQELKHYKKNKTDGFINFFETNWINNKNVETFESRLTMYSEKIFLKSLSKEQINQYKLEIGITTQNLSDNRFSRDISLVKMFDLNSEDICSCCCDKYNISDRTHLKKCGTKYYMEIHHVISLGRNQELDNIDNLVKLCPGCHASLRKGTTSKSYQIDNIKKILLRNQNIFEFSSCFFNESTLDKLSENIWENLK
ncbi:MAG: HNH endonuclease [Mycoplasma sp.]